MKHWISVGTILLLAVTAGLFWYWGRETTELDVAPWGKVIVDGATTPINPVARPYYSDPAALTDTFHQADHLYQLPTPSSRVTVQWPLPIAASHFALLGWSYQPASTLRVSAGHGGGESLVRQGVWAARPAQPPLFVGRIDQPIDQVTLRFAGESTIILNNLSVFLRLPRWQACVLALLWLFVGPWLVGLSFILALFGWASLLRAAGWNVAESAAHRLVTGLGCMTILAVIFCLLPQSPLARWTIGGLLLFPCIYEAWQWCTIAIGRQRPRPGDDLVRWIPVTALLLLAAVIGETYGLTNNRVVPVDHVRSLAAARYLSSGLALPVEFNERPWLVDVLFAPIDAACERWSYPCYLGYLSALNATVVIALGCWG